MHAELTRAEIDQLLHDEQIGRIGYQDEGRTHIVPVSYVYDGESVYVLSSEGAKVRAMREHPRVCFEVEHVERWYNWRTAIAWGTFEELHDTEAERAYHLLHSRLTPPVEFESGISTRGDPPPPDIAVKQFVLYRIHLEERTGRYVRL